MSNYFRNLVPKNSNKEIILIEGYPFRVSGLSICGSHIWSTKEEREILLRTRGKEIKLSSPYGKGSNPKGGHTYVSSEGDWVEAKTKVVDSIPVHDGYEIVKPIKRVLLQGGRLELLVF
jgi:hypothetical protein